MFKRIFSFLIIFTVFLTVVIGLRPVLAAATFSDVPDWHWAYDWIERLYNAGVTSGCGSGKYCPDNQVTRAEMAKFLLTAIHGEGYTPPSVDGTTGFSDVSTNFWAAAWIKQLAAEGITSGCGGGNYCPNSQVTRAEMAKFLLSAKYGFLYSPPSVGGSTGFFDVPTNFWAAAWIKQLASDGITSGCGDGNYCPNDNVTRAEMAKFLVITFNLPEIAPIPEPTEEPPVLINPGTYLVGTEINPGIYYGKVGTDIFDSCYWERLENLSGDFSAIIANDNSMGQFYVEIKQTDYAFSINCSITHIDDVPAPNQYHENLDIGTYIVGRDIQYGLYKGQAGENILDSCYWERLSGVSGEFGDIIANDNATGQFYIDVQASDFALSVRCPVSYQGQ